MQGRLVGEADVLAVGVTVVATLVVVGLLAAVAYLLRSVRELRREAEALAVEAHQLLDDLGQAVDRAAEDVRRVDRMVGSAEAISEAVGTASRALGGAVLGPLIKLVSFGAGVARAARVVRGAARPAKEIPAVARESRRRRPAQVGASPGPRDARAPLEGARALGWHRPAGGREQEAHGLMFKRLTWTGVGLVAGFACSKWVEHKVRRRLARYLPAGLRSLQTSAEVRDVARELASTRLAELRHAVKEGRRAMAERELDLRRQLVGAAPAGEELVPAQRRGHAC